MEYGFCQNHERNVAFTHPYSTPVIYLSMTVPTRDIYVTY